MNKKFLLIVCFLIFGCHFACLAVISSGINKVKTPVTFKPKQENNTNRPNMPAHQRISAEFQDGILNIEFQIPEGECKLEYIISSTYQYRSIIFDSSSPTEINIGLIQDKIEFTITTSFGNQYEASIDLSE